MRESFCCMSGEELAVFGAFIASAIAEQYDADELNILSALITVVGDSLAVIAARRSACTSNKEKDSESR